VSRVYNVTLLTYIYTGLMPHSRQTITRRRFLAFNLSFNIELKNPSFHFILITYIKSNYIIFYKNKFINIIKLKLNNFIN
jgi:hypothetical protein